MAFQEDYQQNPPRIDVFGRSYNGTHDTMVGRSGIFYHTEGDIHGVKIIPYISALGQFGKTKDECTLEAQIAKFAQSLHPNVINGSEQTQEITLPNGQNGLAMLVKYGGNTARNNYRLTTEERLTLCIDVAKALTLLHQNNIMHGDISPENIVYNQTLQGIQAAVTDFGEARRIGIDFDFPGGTGIYMDPLRESGIIGYTNDVYSFAMVAEEQLTQYFKSTTNNPFANILRAQLTAATKMSARPSMQQLHTLLHDTLEQEKAHQRQAA